MSQNDTAKLTGSVDPHVEEGGNVVNENLLNTSSSPETRGGGEGLAPVNFQALLFCIPQLFHSNVPL
jgi:hypothetical protein